MSGTNIMAGTSSGGVFLSTNNGTTWSSANNGITNYKINALTIMGSNIFAGTEGGSVFRSTNNGGTWTVINTGLTSDYIYSFALSGTYLIAGTGRGVYNTSNNGTSWSRVSDGLLPSDILSLLVNGNSVFAGTNGLGVWSRPLSQVDAIKADNYSPSVFELEQNYPNPFNPSTRINYTLSKDAWVTLDIYSISGVRIEQLVNEEQGAGSYSVNYQIKKNISSGVYFYRLSVIQSDRTNLTAVKKMIILK